MSSNELRGKVVVVTGAARGLGKSYAEGLAARGATVALADLNQAGAEAAAAAIGDQAAGFYVDVTDETSATQLAGDVVKRFGAIDVVLNNAGLNHPTNVRGLLDISLEQWNQWLAVNLTGALLVSRACVPALQARGGRIINQSSMAAYASAGVYSISKLALNGLTTSLARELGPFQITVNAIAPGMMESPYVREHMDPDLQARVLGQQAIARWGNSGDLVSMAAFLASEESGWITGQVFLVDGGSILRP